MWQKAIPECTAMPRGAAVKKPLILRTEFGYHRCMTTAIRSLYTYETPPIDFWDGWIPLSEFVRRLVGHELAEKAPFSLDAVMAFILEAAHGIASQRGFLWEGDVRGADMYVALPSGEFP